MGQRDGKQVADLTSHCPAIVKNSQNRIPPLKRGAQGGFTSLPVFNGIVKAGPCLARLLVDRMKKTEAISLLSDPIFCNLRRPGRLPIQYRCR